MEVSGIESYESTLLPIPPTGYCAVKQNKNDVAEINHQEKVIGLPSNIFHVPSLTHQVSEDDSMALSSLTHEKKRIILN